MLRITWVTNMSPPYRRPVWAHLAASAHLRVYLLHSSQRDVARANRGQDWQAIHGTGTAYGPYLPRSLNLRLAGLPLPILVAARKLIRGTDVLVLGGWEAPAYWQLMALARIKACPIIGFYESTLATNRFKRGIVAAARRYFFRQLDLIVVPGAAARQALLAFGVDESKVVEAFNAVDVQSMRHAATRARRSLPVVYDASHKLIYVGQLIPRKNLDSLILAVALLDPAYTLTIVGEGSLKERLRHLVDDLGISDRITFQSYTDNQALPSILCEHSTLVLPSTEEVWGLVVNEALACGLHVVVSKNCGVAPSVNGMQGVWLSKTGPAEISQQIQNSSRSWVGPISSPEILRHTPEAFAEKFLAAAKRATIRDRDGGRLHDYL